MYQVFLHPRTEKFFKKIPKKFSDQLTNKIDLLANDPFKESLDIKKLANCENYYRLRHRDIRVIYSIDTIKKIIYIEDIDFRGNIY